MKSTALWTRWNVVLVWILHRVPQDHLLRDSIVHHCRVSIDHIIYYHIDKDKHHRQDRRSREPLENEYQAERVLSLLAVESNGCVGMNT